MSEVALKADIHEHDKFDANDPERTCRHSATFGDRIVDQPSRRNIFDRNPD